MNYSELSIYILFDYDYYIKSCKSKNRYESEYDAKYAADILMHKDYDLTLDWYKCQFCNGWHLTSRNSK